MLTWALLYYIAEWLLRIAMLLHVPRKRSPAAARSWLLLIFVLPVVGVLIYALIGRVYMPRRRIEMQRQASLSIRQVLGPLPGVRPASSAAPAATGYGETIALAERLGAFPLMDGNRIALLDDYEEASERLVAEIDRATHHAHVMTYIWGNDRTGLAVAGALERAAARGVECRAIMDSVGSKKALSGLLPRMRERGIEATAALPVGLFRRSLARFDLRNHRKIAVVDGRVGFIGSQNLVDPDFKPGIVNEEVVARVEGPLVNALQGIFLSDWYFETGKAVRDAGYGAPAEAAGGSVAQALPSGPGYEEENTQRVLVALLHEARRRVVITTPYFIPDGPFLHALTSARLRNVEIHLVVPKQVDQFLVGMAQQSFYADLLDCGVAIHRYRPRFLHAKHVTVDDDVALIGSSNMDIRSFALNAEAGVLIFDPDVVADLRRIQERYFADSELLGSDGWNRRGLGVQLAQNTARLVSSVL